MLRSIIRKEKVIMKKIVVFIGTILLMMLLGACSQGTVKADKLLNISADNVEGVYAISQMHGKPKEIELREEVGLDVIDKLKLFKLKEIPDEDKNGWEYSFRIELKDGTRLLIKLGENIFRINGVEYEIVGDKTDFSYLFDN